MNPYNDNGYCPRCSTELDDQERCPACWGDIFGLCEDCIYILEEDGTCPLCGKNQQEVEQLNSEIKPQVDENLKQLQSEPKNLLEQMAERIEADFAASGHTLIQEEPNLDTDTFRVTFPRRRR